MKQSDKQLYKVPVIKVIEVRQESVICSSVITIRYGDDTHSGDTHWTVDHKAEHTTRDDEWEQEQVQDWGDSWGDY